MGWFLDCCMTSYYQGPHRFPSHHHHHRHKRSRKPNDFQKTMFQDYLKELKQDKEKSNKKQQEEQEQKQQDAVRESAPGSQPKPTLKKRKK